MRLLLRRYLHTVNINYACDYLRRQEWSSCEWMPEEATVDGTAERRFDVSKVLPPPEEKTTRTSMELPDDLLHWLKETAAKHKHTSSKAWTRDEFTTWGLRWFRQEYEAEMAKKLTDGDKKKGGK